MRPVKHTDSLEIPKPQHISHDVFLPGDEIISLESDEEFIPTEDFSIYFEIYNTLCFCNTSTL